MPAYTTPLDILNAANQLLGAPRVGAYGTAVKSEQEGEFTYDKVRSEELEGNLWKFATRTQVLRAIGIDTVMWTPPAWAAGSYSPGAIVSYSPVSGPYNGETRYWKLTATKTVSNTTTPDLDADWHLYTGPLAIDLYNTGVSGNNTGGLTYMAGEIVLVPATYASGTTYSINQVVNYNSQWYVSLTNSNLGNTPSTSTTNWVLWTSVGRANNSYGVTASNSPIPLTYPGSFSVYVSLYNNNADNPASGTSNWLSLGGTTAPLYISWPLGAGPWYQTSTKNVYRLPNGFLKRAPNNPKGDLMDYLGAASGVAPDDWLIENNYIITNDATVITLRFVGDVIDVTDMDPLFCRAVAARIAMVNTESVLQDIAKYQRAAGEYQRAITRAKATNSIELGPIAPVENRYVLVRA